MLVHPRPMCPRTKVLRRSVPRTMRPLDNAPWSMCPDPGPQQLLRETWSHSLSGLWYLIKTCQLIFIVYFSFLEVNKKQRSCDGLGVAQRPFRRVNVPTMTDARSARARAQPKPTSLQRIIRVFFGKTCFLYRKRGFASGVDYEFLFFVTVYCTISESREIKVFML